MSSEAKGLLITGGGSGIGAETARRAAARGYRIAVNYRSREAEAKAVVAEIIGKGGQAVALPGDMAREADIVRLFDETERALGPVTHLLNSAGINGRRGRVEEYDAANLVHVLTVNVVGLMLCCREAARRMSTRHGGKGGAIVNVSSMAGTLGGRPGSSAYAASKGAVDAFTKGFAREVAAEGIRVNGLRPGMVLTERQKRLWIEVGQPEEKPIAKACGKADAVVLYPFHHAAEVWWKGIEGKLARQDKLQVWRLPSDTAQALAALAERSMQLQATIQEGALTLSSNLGTVFVEPLRWK